MVAITHQLQIACSSREGTGLTGNIIDGISRIAALDTRTMADLQGNPLLHFNSKDPAVLLDGTGHIDHNKVPTETALITTEHLVVALAGQEIAGKIPFITFEGKHATQLSDLVSCSARRLEECIERRIITYCREGQLNDNRWFFDASSSHRLDERGLRTVMWYLDYNERKGRKTSSNGSRPGPRQSQHGNTTAARKATNPETMRPGQCSALR